MLNGNMVDERIRNPLNSPAHLSFLSPDNKTAVETIYLSTLARRPNKSELEHFVAKLENLRGPRRTNKIQDIYWTLINSIEFTWNH